MSRLARLHIALLSLSASSILRGSQRCLAGITVVLSELPFTLFLALTRTRMWDSALLRYMCARVFHHLGTADGTTVALPPVAIPHFKNTILHFLKKKKKTVISRSSQQEQHLHLSLCLRSVCVFVRVPVIYVLEETSSSVKKWKREIMMIRITTTKRTSQTELTNKNGNALIWRLYYPFLSVFKQL
jgi:hypothetical protein